jgi:hypothetical protein
MCDWSVQRIPGDPGSTISPMLILWDPRFSREIESDLRISGDSESTVFSRWLSIPDLSHGVSSTNLGYNSGRKIVACSIHIISG